MQRETTYLIEEDGTTLGLRDNSGLRPDCSGVCPTFMAEEFIFNQFTGNRTAVNRYEWLSCTRTAIVDCPRNHLLTGSAFAQNQHPYVEFGDLYGSVEFRTEPGARADKLVQPFSAVFARRNR
ncbi:MAG: hypothetical protein WBL40_23565 [Terrimicrobiaceae bacterium]